VDPLRWYKRIGFVGGLVAFTLILLGPAPEGMSPQAKKMAAVTVWMALWWITEATDIAITALIPVPALPLLGIMPSAEVTRHYANHLIFLFMGGFMIALAMEKWDLHRRVALSVIEKMGGRPTRLVLGFIVATGLISMWISNTATTLMMMPVAMAVVDRLAEVASRVHQLEEQLIQRTLGLVLMLGIAYAASIGGVGTIIGTPTNVALVGFVQQRFPTLPPISFVRWMLVGVPLVIVFLPLAWAYLCRFGAPIPLGRLRLGIDASLIIEEKARLGPMKAPEKIVAVVGSITALLWIFREPLRLGWFRLPGWSELLPWPEKVHDATVAMAAAILLCLLPASWRGPVEWKGKQERFVLDWDTIQQRLPWGVLILFGGGFALAAGIEGSGLASWLAQRIGSLQGAPSWVLVPLAGAVASLISSFTSNTATVLMLCPVLAEAAVALGIHPYLLLVPATIAASFVFVLPVSTPPNAIIFGSGWVTVPAMFRAGLGLQLISLVVVPAVVYLLGGAAFGFQAVPG